MEPHSAVAASVGAPSLGPSRGGTRVSVLGGGFRDAYTLRCAFGSACAPVVARYVDESQLECSSPVQFAGGVVVQLSMNGQQYASRGVAYPYQSVPCVSSVSPRPARAEGATAWTGPVGGCSWAAAWPDVRRSRQAGAGG